MSPLTWCLTVSCLILTGMLGSKPSNSLRLLFSRTLLLFSRSLLFGGPLPFLVFTKVSVLFTAGLLRSSTDRLRTVNGSLNCQDIAARATFLALREWPKETSLTHTCAIGPCRRKHSWRLFTSQGGTTQHPGDSKGRWTQCACLSDVKMYVLKDKWTN